MEIRFKTRKTGEISALDYNEFKDRILKGEIFPQDEVQDRILTNNEWRTVDNLRIFHNLSPSAIRAVRIWRLEKEQKPK